MRKPDPRRLRCLVLQQIAAAAASALLAAGLLTSAMRVAVAAEAGETAGTAGPVGGKQDGKAPAAGEAQEKAEEEKEKQQPEGEKDETGEDTGTILGKMSQPTMPIGLTYPLGLIDATANFARFQWLRLLDSARARTGPGRYLEPAEQGFFEGRPTTTVNAWPLYEKMILPAPRPRGAFPAGEPRLTTRTHIFWPFVTWERGPGRKALNVRPLFRYETAPNFRDVRFLYPLFSYRRRGENVRASVFPIFYHRKNVTRVGKGAPHVDSDSFILPILFWGSDSREGKYFAFFPLFGKVKGLLGKKSISFVLWPLWTQVEEKNYKSWNFIWPVFGGWRGEKQSGWRVWPLYGRNTFPGRFDRRFFLWPLVHWWKLGLDTRYPGRMFAVLPLWLKIHLDDTRTGKPRLDYWNFLLLFSGKKHARRNWREVHFPWPFISWARADGLRVFKLWPLYGHRQSNLIRHRFSIWPLYRFILERKPTKLRRRWSIAWIFNITKIEWLETLEDTTEAQKKDKIDDKEEGEQAVRKSFKVRRTAPPRRRSEPWVDDPRNKAKLLKLREALNPTAEQGAYRRSWTVSLWPLFYYRKGPYGGKVFRMLTVLPHDDTGSFAASWLPFSILYHYQRTADGVRESRALFGLYRHRRSEIERRVNGIYLFDYERHGNKKTEVRYRKFQILKGLFAYERVLNKRRIKLLWIPLGRISKELRAEERREQETAYIQMAQKARGELRQKMRPPEPPFPWAELRQQLREKEKELDRASLTQ